MAFNKDVAERDLRAYTRNVYRMGETIDMEIRFLEESPSQFSAEQLQKRVDDLCEAFKDVQVTMLELQKHEEDEDAYEKLNEDFDTVHKNFNTVCNRVYRVLANYMAKVPADPAAAAPAPAAVAVTGGHGKIDDTLKPLEPLLHTCNHQELHGAPIFWRK